MVDWGEGPVHSGDRAHVGCRGQGAERGRDHAQLLGKEAHHLRHHRGHTEMPAPHQPTGPQQDNGQCGQLPEPADDPEAGGAQRVRQVHHRQARRQHQGRPARERRTHRHRVGGRDAPLTRRQAHSHHRHAGRLHHCSVPHLTTLARLHDADHCWHEPDCRWRCRGVCLWWSQPRCTRHPHSFVQAGPPASLLPVPLAHAHVPHGSAQPAATAAHVGGLHGIRTGAPSPVAAAHDGGRRIAALPGHTRLHAGRAARTRVRAVDGAAVSGHAARSRRWAVRGVSPRLLPPRCAGGRCRRWIQPACGDAGERDALAAVRQLSDDDRVCGAGRRCGADHRLAGQHGEGDTRDVRHQDRCHQ
mmetsp:Transcript_7911/g.19470  ORF Transcript_7911/g.19470 Transcript_7911/m.19470 type:complete len:358 (+) Transcript_7911:1080-2153(+)